MEDQLQYILSTVNTWLKFGENKNAALLAVDSAVVFGVVRLIVRSDHLGYYASIYLYLGIFFLAVSGLFCLISFIPNLEIPWLATRREVGEGDNLLFYGDVADYSPEEFLKELRRRREQETTKIELIEQDYAEQIIINSRIALLKYQCFNGGIWLAITALVTPIGTLLIYLLKRNNLTLKP